MSRHALSAAAAALMICATAAPAAAQSPGYSALDLLSPCQEADNDARWGAAAEAECEQYILGFIGAMEELGAIGAGSGVCPPEQNAADEARWAFMRWVHADYSARKVMSASAALMASLKEGFACGG